MKRKILIILLVFSFFLSGSYYEENIGKQLDYAENSGFMDEISDEAKAILERIGIDGLDPEKLGEISAKDIFILIWESFVSKIKEPFYSVLTVTAAAMICSVAGSFCENFSLTGNVINIVSALSSAAIFLVPVKNLISSASAVIDECSDFILGFVPVYTSAIIASGYVSSGAGFRTMMLGTVTVISKLSDEIIVPLICIYLALCVAGSVSDMNIGEISKTIKNFAVWLLGITMTVFSGIMGLGTLISSSADSAFSKTAKFLIGSAVPIVGSTVSDALSTVKSCLGVTRTVLGTYAVIVIAAIFLPPIISLLSWKICLSVSSGIGDFFGNKSLSGLLSAVSSVVGIMLALVVVTAVMFIFAVSIMLMTGGG